MQKVVDDPDAARSSVDAVTEQPAVRCATGRCKRRRAGWARSLALRSAPVVALALMQAACVGDSAQGPSTPPPSAASSAPASTGALPFTYQSSGESSTPTFTIQSAGAYAVTYRLTAVPGQPDCSYDMQLVSDSGQSVPVVHGAAVRASTPQTAHVSAQLTPGHWRFLVATNSPSCAWQVGVTGGG